MGLLGIAADLYANKKARELQKEENAITRKREDNAHQREVADLKASGLNPLIATNGAQTNTLDSGANFISAMGESVREGTQNAIENKLARKNYELQNEKLKQEVEQQKLENEFTQKQLNETERHNKASEENGNALNRMINEILNGNNPLKNTPIGGAIDNAQKIIEKGQDLSKTLISDVANNITNPTETWNNIKTAVKETPKYAKNKAKEHWNKYKDWWGKTFKK